MIVKIVKMMKQARAVKLIQIVSQLHSELSTHPPLQQQVQELMH